jgi:hypothetical protein
MTLQTTVRLFLFKEKSDHAPGYFRQLEYLELPLLAEEKRDSGCLLTTKG